MKKAFDQTVRDIKRGVNKKVLKVPSIEQKVLDATSNESWGPHGSLLAEIAMDSRNYHEYQMIMSVIWKRVNDTGKNWRHVYKGLTVLEYLVANGSERVIEEIKEHAYQISSLSDFQYLDHTGKDQGSNVRKKSQSIVALVNDKEKLQVRQKAAANWDKFHKTSGGMKQRPGFYPGAGGYEYEDRNGYGREREYSYGGEERSGRDRYRDDEYRGRRSVDGDNYGRRSRSSDRDRERAYEDVGPYSSRLKGFRSILRLKVLRAYHHHQIRVRTILKVMDITGSASFVLLEKQLSTCIKRSIEWIQLKMSMSKDPRVIPKEFHCLLKNDMVFNIKVTEFNYRFGSALYTVLRTDDDQKVMTAMANWFHYWTLKNCIVVNDIYIPIRKDTLQESEKNTIMQYDEDFNMQNST